MPQSLGNNFKIGKHIKGTEVRKKVAEVTGLPLGSVNTFCDGYENAEKEIIKKNLPKVGEVTVVESLNCVKTIGHVEAGIVESEDGHKYDRSEAYSVGVSPLKELVEFVNTGIKISSKRIDDSGENKAKKTA